MSAPDPECSFSRSGARANTTWRPPSRKAIFTAVYRTLEKHKDISGFAAAVTADLTILNLKYAPGRSGMSVDPSSDSSIHLAAMEVLKQHFSSGADVITRRKLAAQRLAL